MGKRPSASFRVTFVLEINDEVRSLVLVDDSRFTFPEFAEFEGTASIKLLEAHITRIEEPKRPQPRRLRPRRRPRKQLPSTP